MTSKICLTISGARPSEGSSSSSRRGRPSARGRSPASAARRPTACRRAGARRSFRRGNSAKIALQILRRNAAKPSTDGAHLQVLEHRHAREDAPALRRLGDRAAARSRASAARVMSRPAKMIVPSRARGLPKIVIIRVDLPAPLAPISVTISPSCDVDVDALQRDDVAVVGLDAAHVRAAGRPGSERS